MKRVPLFLFIYIFICLPALVARAEPVLPKNRVRIECHMVIVPQADALALVPDLQDDTKVEAAWARIESMIREGKAALVADLVGQGALGAKVQLECCEELRYATEYEPPQLPTETPREHAAEIWKAWPHVGIVPTSFEARNTGQMLSIEVTPEAENGALSVAVMAQHVRFLRWNKIDAGRLASGERLSLEQPVFHDMKCDEHFPLENGKRVLLSVHRVPDSERPAFEIFVLRLKLENPADASSNSTGKRK